MSMDRPPFRCFRKRLLAREHLLGTFIKIPTTHATEIVGSIGFDFVVFDQEHAPLDSAVLDTMIVGARAADIAAIVRVPDAQPWMIQTVLDAGASGVLVPHVTSVETARGIASACRYRNGTRGFANTTRAGDFGARDFVGHKDAQDDEVACVAMIEDMEAVNAVDDILRVEGIDAIFIGRGDLTATLEAPSMTSEETMAIVAPIMSAARAINKPVIMLSPDRKDAELVAGLGATAFLVQSDQGFLRSAALTALSEFRPPIR